MERKKFITSNNPTTDFELLQLCNDNLYYDPESGIIQWTTAGACRKSGYEAGTLDRTGYISIGIGGYRYGAHNLAFLITHGYIPEWPSLVEHEDKIRSHNTITNLRHATPAQNQANTEPREGCLSKYKGVGPNRKRWRMSLQNGENNIWKSFKCEHAAARFWNTAARMYHGHKFCYTNIVDACSCSECN